MSDSLGHADCSGAQPAERQMVSVDAQALRTILQALTGPAHYIREIQATRSIAALTGDDPIGTLIEDFNRAAAGGKDGQRG